MKKDIELRFELLITQINNLTDRLARVEQGILALQQDVKAIPSIRHELLNVAEDVSMLIENDARDFLFEVLKNNTKKENKKKVEK